MIYFLAEKQAYLTSAGLLALWWIPPLVVVLGYSWSRAIDRHIETIGRYIAEIEKIYADPRLGWEQFISHRKARFSWTLPIFITLLLITCIAAAKNTF